MQDDDKKKADRLLSDINGSLTDLDQIETTYIQAKERKVKELNALLAQLAVFADTKATRAYVLRELYWHRNVPGSVLEKAFGLTLTKIRLIAGTLIREFPCALEWCTKRIQKEFTSRSSLKDFDASSLICAKCIKTREQEPLWDRMRARLADRERQEELDAMSWSAYLNTPEWNYIRDLIIVASGYGCLRDTCSGQLTIFRSKTFSHVNDHYLGGAYRLLCNDCLPEYEDLLDLEKREIVEEEFLQEIKEKYQN